MHWILIVENVPGFSGLRSMSMVAKSKCNHQGSRDNRQYIKRFSIHSKPPLRIRITLQELVFMHVTKSYRCNADLVAATGRIDTFSGISLSIVTLQCRSG